MNTRALPVAGPWRQGAFTVVELIVVLAVISLLAAFHLQGLSHTRNRSHDVTDFYNNKMLMAAANMYAADQNDTLPGCGWGEADDAWAYSKNIPLSYSGQFDALRHGQLFPYVKEEKIFMCPIDKPDSLFYQRRILITSYAWNAAVGGYGNLTTPTGLGSYKITRFRSDAIIQWEADGAMPFYFNDASAAPDEGISARHGTAVFVGLINGGTQRLLLSQWFTSSYAGTYGQRGTSIPASLLPNPLWCNPGSRLGLEQ